MLAAIELLFGQRPLFEERQLLNPSPLSNQLMAIVHDSGNPQKDFERRTICSVEDNSAVDMKCFERELKDQQCPILPISRMEVKIELKYHHGEVIWDIKDIWSKTPYGTEYLVNQPIIQEQLAARQHSDQEQDETVIFTNVKGDDPGFVGEIRTDSLWQSACLEDSFYSLGYSLKDGSREGYKYDAWLSDHFAKDPSIEASAIKQALSQTAAQSLYNHFIYHLMTGVDPDANHVEYRPTALIPQTNIYHDASKHVTTLVLSACAMSEQVFNHDDPMALRSRFHLVEGRLMEVDSEDSIYNQLSSSSSQAKRCWLEMNQPSVVAPHDMI